MYFRLITAGSLALALATPGFAAREDEVASLNEAVVAAETGAITGSEEMPATQHQQEVLSETEAPEETPDGGVVTGSVEALSPHQREVIAELDEEDRAQASTLLSEARAMAEAGDEQGCMEKVTQTKQLLSLE